MRDHDDARVSSSDFLLVGVEQINHALSLPFGRRPAAYKKSFLEFVPKYKEALLSVKDGEESQHDSNVILAPGCRLLPAVSD